MEKLDKNLLIETAIELDLKDLISLCQVSKRMRNILCDNKDFWMRKLHKEFPYTIGRFKNVNYRNIYEQTRNSVFREAYLDAAGKELNIDWRKYLKFIDLNITYFYKVTYLQFYLEFEFGFHELSRFFSKYFEERFIQAEEILFKKYKHLIEIADVNSDESEDEDNIDLPYISGKDILNLFEPLLLHALKQNNIPIRSQGISIQPDEEYEITISSDI